MKKKTNLLLLICILALSLVGVVGCTKTTTENPTTTQKDTPTTTVEEHVHSWGEGVVTKEPTCTEAGARTYTCSCGETKVEDIEPLGHTSIFLFS